MKKLAQWHKDDEKSEDFLRHLEQFADFLSGNCGDCHGREDDFEDCK